MNLPVEVIEAARQDRCALFLGNRASVEAAEAAGGSCLDQRGLAKQLGWKKPSIVAGKKGTVIGVEDTAAAFERANGRPALVAALTASLGGGAPSAAHRIAVARFPLIFTTNYDDLVERAAAEAGVPIDVLGRQSVLPAPLQGRCTLVRLRGELARPDTLVVTAADHAARPLGVELKKQLRLLMRQQVVLFVGFRPDEEEFERLFSELSDAYGGELPRCHLAVAQGPIDDYLWQKWVWRGLLMFTADPVECLAELEARRS
ncbi:MAG: SIR2 family protein [Myxococcales bacterium]|nr:SIR2 family protein [Myxococcales bacterium]